MMVMNSTSVPAVRRRSWMLRKPRMCRPWMPAKISSCSKAWYLSAFPGVVHPCQIRLIIIASPPLRFLCTSCSSVLFFSVLCGYPSLPHFTHQRQQVCIRIPEKRHPQLMVRHLGHEFGGLFEDHPAAHERIVSRLQVRHLEVDDRAAGFLIVCPGGRVQHQADTIAVEESQSGWSLEQEVHAQHIPVERDCLINVG